MIWDKTYSKTELEKRKFRLTDIKRAIKLVNNENVSGDTNMSITKLIKFTT